MSMKTLVGQLGMAVLTMACASSILGQTTQPAAEPRTTMEHWQSLKWDTSQRGRQIDLSGYKRTFHDDFKAMNIVKEDSEPGPSAVWFAPGHGAYRAQCPLRKDGPFAIVDEGVRLRVEKVGDKWFGACMTSVNTKGQGFAQKYGYFEMTAEYRYPAPSQWQGVWAGFWLKSQKDYFTNGTTTRTEIDINEFYGDDGYHPTVHLWPAAKLSPESTITKHVGNSGFKSKLAPDLFASLKSDGVVKGFHTYGGEITPQWVIMYFDRKELGRFPTVDEFKTPLYMLVSSDTRKIKPEQPAAIVDMIVRNVSAYLPVVPYKE